MPKTDCTDILKALADRTRVRIVKALLTEPHGVNDLAEALDLSQYNVSKHLRVLREAGIIAGERNGRHMECSIAPEFERSLVQNQNVLDLGCCTFRFGRNCR